MRSLSSDANEVPIVGLENGLAFNVNSDGRLLAFYATEASGELTAGLTLYNDNTGEYVSVESALPTCTTQSSGLIEPNCEGIPTNLVLNTYFSADGSHLLMADSSFPSGSDPEFILELSSGALYRIPSNFTSFQGMVSGDSSVFAAPSQESENVFFIAKR